MRTSGRRTSPAEVMVAHWDDVASSYAARYIARNHEAHSFRIRQQRVCELFDKPESRVLDIGCGPGIMAEYLLRNECEVFGVDISEEMIHECIERFRDRPAAHFSVGKIEDLQFPTAYFDAVICMGVVEYIADDESAVKEMARVTRPGGTVIVTVPNNLSPHRVWDRFVYRKATDSLKRLMGRRRKGIFHKEYIAGSYRRLLQSHGLQVTDVVYYSLRVFPSPLDVFFRRLSVATSVKLERLARSRMGWLGTGFIVKAVKTE